MKTKEEVIKEAWGEYYNMGVGIDKNGWLSENYLTNDQCILFNYDESFEYKNVFGYRPKSLQGIENNNGWIKIESEKDLPKNGNYWVIYNDDTISDCVKENELFEDDEYWLKNITHYQQINKPQPPLY